MTNWWEIFSRSLRSVFLQGMDKKSLGHHLGIQPLFVIMAAGMTFVAAYTIRLATRTTDIQWVKNDVCMNDNLRDKQFQMLNPAGHDLAGAGKNIPDYRKQ